MARPGLTCNREKISVDQVLDSYGPSKDPEDSFSWTEYFSGRLSDIAKQQISLVEIIDRIVAEREKHKYVLKELEDQKNRLSTLCWNHLVEQESRNLKQIQARLKILKGRMIGLVKEKKELVDYEGKYRLQKSRAYE